MLRRHMLSVVGGLALGGLLGVQASGQNTRVDSGKTKSVACVCCGDACTCPACGCRDCCGVKAEKSCCPAKAGVPATGQADEADCSCCGDACTCTACGDCC